MFATHINNDMNIIKFRLLTLLLLFPFLGFGQIPPGYYDNAEGLSGDQLRTALFNIISPHSVKSYSSLWQYFSDTDRKANNYVWDMYSDVPGGDPAYDYTFFTDQCGNYSGDCSCYNREDAFPKSGVGNQSPMNTDLYHLYPTDGYTNGQRGNYPFGETNNATWTSTNGSMKGPSSYPGYTGTIFEPIDEYKGDFARTYFYMLTRYENKINNWNSPMLQGDDFSEWAKNLLMEWHANDPVSEKEINRNNEVYDIQINRNPFIDHPEYADEIWGNPTGINDYYVADVQLSYSDYAINISSESIVFETLVIFDTRGGVIAEYTVNNDRVPIDNELSQGIYIALLHGVKGNAVVRFVVLP
jgi:endonuclease I